MTDHPAIPTADARSSRRPVRRRRPGPGTVIWGSLASFAALFAFLTYQLRSGHDPALGSAAAASKAQKVLVRRVIHRRVVTTVIPPSPGSSVPSASSSPSTSSAPVVSAPAPAPVSPPVTTSAS